MYQDFVAGWIAGGTGLLLGHPLDTVKARLQTTNNYNGILDCFVKTFKNESILGFYKGMFAPFMSVGFLNSLLFSGYGLTLKYLHPNEKNIEHRKGLPMSEILLASVVGSCFQMIPAIPVELVKTKLQVQTEAQASVKAKYHGPLDCVKTLYKTGGIRALYHGGSVMAFRDFYGNLFYIPVYELIYRQLHKRDINDSLSQIIAGGTAGSTSWLSICPVEVVKNKIQTSSSVSPHKNEIIETILTVFKTDGIRGFYRGGLVLVIRGFPVNAFIFVAYSKVVTELEKLH
uniref:Mitochondrial carrier protein n=1 Tax=Panagrolaimus sp. JU765 TaxID=591449 RepID=A0AC34RI26_9BILA